MNPLDPQLNFADQHMTAHLAAGIGVLAADAMQLADAKPATGSTTPTNRPDDLDLALVGLVALAHRLGVVP